MQTKQPNDLQSRHSLYSFGHSLFFFLYFFWYFSGAVVVVAAAVPSLICPSYSKTYRTRYAGHFYANKIIQRHTIMCAQRPNREIHSLCKTSVPLVHTWVWLWQTSLTKSSAIQMNRAEQQQQHQQKTNKKPYKWSAYEYEHSTALVTRWFHFFFCTSHTHHYTRIRSALSSFVPLSALFF